jgi:hypothetical protein
MFDLSWVFEDVTGGMDLHHLTISVQETMTGVT